MGMANGRIIVEVAVSSVEDAVAAQGAGADRIELSCALELGGLTPSTGLIEQVRRACHLPIVAMLRPRAGGFVYSNGEFETMLRDVAGMEAVEGLAFGFLHADGTIDRARCRQTIDAVGAREAVFHRAFDVVPDPLIALEQLIELGFKRVLTSGQAATALEGVELIRRLIKQAAGRIVILPGSGIRSYNVAELLKRSDCRQVHGTFSTIKSDLAGAVCKAEYPAIDPAQVAHVRQIVDNIGRFGENPA
jgi:copper homeostasis protein